MGDGESDCSGMAGEILVFPKLNNTEIKVGDVKYCFKTEGTTLGITKGCAHDVMTEAFESMGLWGAGCVNLLDGQLKVCLCSTDLCNSSHKLKISIIPFITFFWFLYAMNF